MLNTCTHVCLPSLAIIAAYGKSPLQDAASAFCGTPEPFDHFVNHLRRSDRLVFLGNYSRSSSNY